MKGNNSTKARHQDLEGTNLLDQQLRKSANIWVRSNYFLAISMDNWKFQATSISIYYLDFVLEGKVDFPR